MANAALPPGSSRPRFQFSLAWLLLLVTAVAILLGLMTTLGIVVLASLTWCVVPTPLVISAIFDRGDRQAFSIGALIPWFALITLRIPPTGSFVSLTVWLLTLGVFCGAVATATRRWILRQEGG